jgi:hypothetical protein
MKKLFAFLTLFAFCLMMFETVEASPPKIKKNSFISFVQATSIHQVIEKPLATNFNPAVLISIDTIAESLPMEIAYGNFRIEAIIYKIDSINVSSYNVQYKNMTLDYFAANYKNRNYLTKMRSFKGLSCGGQGYEQSQRN